jgi:hypothetical protein
MLAPPAFPEWLPPAVAEEGQRRSIPGMQTTIVFRLATDERMKFVWRSETTRRFSGPQISDAGKGKVQGPASV